MRRYKGIIEYLKTGGYDYNPPSFGSGKETPEEYRARKERQQEERERREREYQEREREREYNASLKESLISRAEALSSSTDWKRASQEMKSLMNEWKGIGSAGKDRNDNLWNRFRSARQHYFDRANEHYEKKKREYEKKQREFENKANQKRSLIARANSLSVHGPHMDNVADEAKRLNSEWKNIGFSGKENEDSLWREFRSAQDKFWSEYKKRKSEIREERKRLKEQIKHKTELIENFAEGIQEARQAYGELKEMSRSGKQTEIVATDQFFRHKPFDELTFAELGIAAVILGHWAHSKIRDVKLAKKAAIEEKRELISKIKELK